MIKVSGSIVHGSNGFLAHNDRTYMAKNIDSSRTKDNVYIKQQSVDEAYNELFTDTIEDYNAHQKRADRKKSVKGYLEELNKNKDKFGSEKPFYELIVQIGDKDNCSCVNNPIEAQKAKEALIKFADTWSERNPNLKAFNISIHMDESTPHMHIDYIPVAEGCYKQGLKRRNSLTKALELQGLGVGKGKFDNSSIRWQAQERAALKEIALEYGFEIVDQNIKRADLSVQEYKRKQQQLDQELENVQISKHDTFFGRAIIKEYELEKLEEAQKLVAQKEIIADKTYAKAIEQEIRAKHILKVTREINAEEEALHKVELNSLEVQIKKANADLETINSKTTSIINQATRDAEQIRQEAEETANKTTEQANKAAITKLDQANAEAKNILNKADTDAKSKLDQADAEAKSKVEALTKDIELKASELSTSIQNAKQREQQAESRESEANIAKHLYNSLYQEQVGLNQQLLNANQEIKTLKGTQTTLELSNKNLSNQVNSLTNDLERTKKQLTQETKYYKWVLELSKKPRSNRTPSGNTRKFDYNDTPALTIYENGVVLDSFGNKFNLTDIATKTDKTFTICNTTWTTKSEIPITAWNNDMQRIQIDKESEREAERQDILDRAEELRNQYQQGYDKGKSEGFSIGRKEGYADGMNNGEYLGIKKTLKAYHIPYMYTKDTTLGSTGYILKDRATGLEFKEDNFELVKKIALKHDPYNSQYNKAIKSITSSIDKVVEQVKSNERGGMSR